MSSSGTHFKTEIRSHTPTETNSEKSWIFNLENDAALVTLCTTNGSRLDIKIEEKVGDTWNQIFFDNRLELYPWSTSITPVGQTVRVTVYWNTITEFDLLMKPLSGGAAHIDRYADTLDEPPATLDYQKQLVNRIDELIETQRIIIQHLEVMTEIDFSEFD